MNYPLEVKIQNPFLSQDTLDELACTMADRMLAAIDAENNEDVIAICQKARNEHMSMHDAYMVWSSQTQSYVYTRLGLEPLRAMLRQSVTPWLRPLAEQFRNGMTRESVTTLAKLVRTECIGTVIVEEDHDHMVFVLDGWSNQRLLKEGGYSSSSPNPLAIVAEADSLTGFIANTPVYITGIRMAELLMIEWLGYPAFVLESTGDGVERLVLFKNPTAVPQTYFERVGAQKDAEKIDAACSVAGGRLFSDEELKQLAQPYLQQAAIVFAEGRKDLAQGLSALAKWEWYPGHHLGRDWITGQLSYLEQHHPDLINDYFEKVYEHGCLDPMLDAVRQMDVASCVSWYAVLFHQHTMRMRIEEDADKFTIITEPCGSGGRLLAEGAYDSESPKGFVRVKKRDTGGFQPNFQLDNFPAYCMHCPSTNRTILERGGPYIQLVDPDIRDGEIKGHCKFYMFKNPEAIPERLYTQVGLTKPASKIV